MAHYAKLGINSKVINVEVVANSDCQNADGVEDEEVGRQFLERIHNWPLWKKTSYNTAGNKHASGDDSKAFRGNYAGIGYTYDEDNDIFMPTKPYTSWVLNTAEARWQSPIGDAPELSEDEKETHRYDWNESGQSWDKVEK
jgi:hypothetical protein